MYTRAASDTWSGSLTDGIDHTVDLLAPPPGTSAGMEEVATRVQIEGVTGLADYANLERLLQSVPGVRHAGVTELDRRRHRDVRGDGARRGRRPRARVHRLDAPGARRGADAGSSSTTISPPAEGAGSIPSAAPCVTCPISSRLIRIALVWPIAAALNAGEQLAALSLFVAAAVSDGLDGYLAKRFDWTSELGKVLDPLADKLLLVTVFVESAWLGLMPWWLTAAVVARDVMIALGALVYRLWFGPLRGTPDRAEQDQHRGAARVRDAGHAECGLRPAAAGDARCVRGAHARHHGAVGAALRRQVHAAGVDGARAPR